MFKNCAIIGKNVLPSGYHAENDGKRGTPEFIMSTSALKQFVECPEKWVYTGRKIVELVERMAKSESPKLKKRIRKRIKLLTVNTRSTKWGRLVDAALLTPDSFDSQFAVAPEQYSKTVLQCPSCDSITESKMCRKCKCEREEKSILTDWSIRSEECQKWSDEQEAAGKEVVSSEMKEYCDEAVARIMANPLSRKFVECSDKQVHVQGEWHDPATGLVVPVRCLIDLAPRIDTEYVPGVEMPWPKCLGDLKTSDTIQVAQFTKKIKDFGWHIQARFDLDLYTAATNEDRTDWLIIGSENSGVWQPFRRIIPSDFLDIGKAAYVRILENYCFCLKNNIWPGADDNDIAINGFTPCQPYPWMAEEEAFAPKYNFTPQESPAEYQCGDDVTP